MRLCCASVEGEGLPHWSLAEEVDWIIPHLFHTTYIPIAAHFAFTIRYFDKYQLCAHFFIV